MATMKKPTIQGGYPKGSVNQGPGAGAFEGRVVSRAPQSILGNAKARDVGPGGPGTGRDVYRSGANMEHGPATQGYENPAMDDLDRYYGYGKEQGR